MDKRLYSVAALLLIAGLIVLQLPDRFHSLYFLAWGCACFTVAYARQTARRSTTEETDVAPNQMRERIVSGILVAGGAAFFALGIAHLIRYLFF